MKIKKINCIITAAGKSSRFKDKKNKILFEIKNKSLIENIFLKIKDYSNKVIIICNKNNINQIKEILNKYKKKVKILYKIQENPNGMATAIATGIKYINTNTSSIIL